MEESASSKRPDDIRILLSWRWSCQGTNEIKNHLNVSAQHISILDKYNRQFYKLHLITTFLNSLHFPAIKPVSLQSEMDVIIGNLGVNGIYQMVYFQEYSKKKLILCRAVLTPFK